MPGIDVVRRKLLAVVSRRRAGAFRVWAGVPDRPDYWRLWLVGVMIFGVRWLEMLAVAVFAYQRTGALFGAVDRRRRGTARTAHGADLRRALDAADVVCLGAARRDRGTRGMALGG